MLKYFLIMIDNCQKISKKVNIYLSFLLIHAFTKYTTNVCMENIKTLQYQLCFTMYNLYGMYLNVSSPLDSISFLFTDQNWSNLSTINIRKVK